MTNEEFDALVSRLEKHAKLDPGGYKLKVVLLALLGNAYVTTIVFLIVAVLAGLIASLATLGALAVKLLLVVGFFLWLVIKSLWVKIDPPDGTEVNKIQAPELFAMIENLRHALHTQQFNHVLITEEFNAGVVQAPRLGVFGWPRNYLLIGLPLMKTLTVSQFKAVLAHEFGHLANNHGRMTNWIYRQRLRWSRLATSLEATDSGGGFLFKPFLNWFSPYFNAYSFPLARANEYVADQTSAHLTSPQDAAQALSSVNIIGGYLDEQFWPDIHRQADKISQPAFAPYTIMGREVALSLEPADAKRRLDQAMARTTDTADTHPSLNDRLHGIGESPHFAPPAVGEAADRLLGYALEAITTDFNQRWKTRIAPSWERRHREAQESRARLAELNARHAACVELPVQDACERAWLTESMDNDADSALAQFRELYRRAPDDATVCLSLGARLLDRDDSTGCPLVERSIELDDSNLVQCCKLLRDYYGRRGDNVQAQHWHTRLLERAQLLDAANKERNTVFLKDKFDDHDLSPLAMADLRRQLQAIAGITKVYFVRKRVKHFIHSPCYLLGFRCSRWFQWHNKARAAAIVRQIQENVKFPGETLIINIEGENYRFGRKFRWMLGNRIV